jgi:hypothetical protein
MVSYSDTQVCFLKGCEVELVLGLSILAEDADMFFDSCLHFVLDRYVVTPSLRVGRESLLCLDEHPTVHCL